MNKLIILIMALLLPGASGAQTFLRMMPLKSSTHHMSLTREFLQHLADLFKVRTLIETGTARGETTNVAKDIFDVHTIEIDSKLYDFCKKRFSKNKNVWLYHGDSSKKLPEILKKIKGVALFWLDGHNSPGMTQGSVNTPLLQELSLIKQAGIKNAVLLIDDIRCALWQKNNWELLAADFGRNSRALYDAVGTGWPSFLEIIEAVEAINPNYTIAVMGDVLIAFDKSTGVLPSPALKAMTRSLLGYLRDEKDELTAVEKTIAQADDSTFKSIKEQVDILSLHELPCYHSHLHFWYGLMLRHRKQKNAAHEHLIKAKKSGFTHKSIEKYLQKR